MNVYPIRTIFYLYSTSYPIMYVFIISWPSNEPLRYKLNMNRNTPVMNDEQGLNPTSYAQTHWKIKLCRKSSTHISSILIIKGSNLIIKERLKVKKRKSCKVMLRLLRLFCRSINVECCCCFCTVAASQR